MNSLVVSSKTTGIGKDMIGNGKMIFFFTSVTLTE